MHLWNLLRDHLVQKQEERYEQRGRRNNNPPNRQERAPGLLAIRDEPRAGGRGPAAAKSGKGSDRKKNGGAADKILFVSVGKGQTPYCRTYNDKGSCSDSGCRFTHSCNAQMESGSACGSKSHGRANHDGGKHGTVKSR